jgi:hypothetical protein
MKTIEFKYIPALFFMKNIFLWMSFGHGVLLQYKKQMTDATRLHETDCTLESLSR